jgi:hypothetical protein
MNGSRYQKTHLSMSDDMRAVVGSDTRDLFRSQHKQDLPHHMFGLDFDFVLVEKNPYKIVAVLDVKVGKREKLTFTEVIAYNAILKNGFADVFIIYAKCVESLKRWELSIYQYLGGDPVPEPPKKKLFLVQKTKSLEDFQQWEQTIRDNSKKAVSFFS